MEGLATLKEVKTSWDLVDLWEAHEMLDLRAKAQAYIEKRAASNHGDRD